MARAAYWKYFAEIRGSTLNKTFRWDETWKRGDRPARRGSGKRLFTAAPFQNCSGNILSLPVPI